MSNDKDRPAHKLPITAELGDEGGSYGDATLQAEPLLGARGNPRVDPKLVSPAGEEAGAMTASEDTEDQVKDPHEPPEGRR